MKAGKRPRTLLWQIYPAFFAITLMVVISAGWYFMSVLKNYQDADYLDSLQARAALLEPQVEEELRRANYARLQQLSVRAGEQTNTRVTIITPEGTVVAESHEDPARLENHALRPEMATALKGEDGVSQRYSRSVSKNMLYFARPIRVESGEIIGVVRTAIATDRIDERIAAVGQRLISGGVAVLLLVALLCLVVSRRITRPIEQIRLEAQRYASGNLQRRVHVKGSSEIRDLARTLNKMAHQLNERIRIIDKQRSEQDAVLASMVEGVLAVDVDENILRINPAAARLFEAETDDAQGRSVQEVVRRAELLEFVRTALQSDTVLEDDIVMFSGGKEISLQVHGTPLLDQDGMTIGVLIVFNDMTRLRRLERMRQDFVANVSHELKTPITAIKGFIETLLDGALDDRKESEHFLHIVERQVERLNVIIEDLMSLSRIEQSEGRNRFEFDLEPLAPVVNEVINNCSMLAGQSNITLNNTCTTDLSAPVNAPLLEQALTNLVDNAIKYSRPGSDVSVTCYSEDGFAVIAVSDTGCGIEEEHLPRLFERFYRVDKARSRKCGGSGLGLAIVKHIVQIHQGHVDVKSVPGQGSTFTLQIPLQYKA
ncbi:MAG: PAS domain-containing protein [Geobacteraceae bacterium]|nr:PAS domain-containing protein [Geobacteraceae bacterium]